MGLVHSDANRASLRTALRKVTSQGVAQLFSTRIAEWAPWFSLLSTSNHVWSLANWDQYTAQIINKEHANLWRWNEYAVSASLMYFIIYQLSGGEDVDAAVLLVTTNVVMQYLGYLSEKTNDLGEARRTNALGFVLFAAQWTVLMSSFFTSLDQAEDDLPAELYSIIFVMFAFFLMFGLLHTANIESWCPCGAKGAAKYRKVEMGYVILSLTAKTFLLNMILFGSMRPEDTS